MKRIAAFAFAIAVVGSCVGAQGADYKVQTRYSIPGNDGWDYITVDTVGRRL